MQIVDLVFAIFAGMQHAISSTFTKPQCMTVSDTVSTRQISGAEGRLLALHLVL